MWRRLDTSSQTTYDLVDTYAVQHYFVGHHRHTFKKIYELFRFVISI